MHCSKDGRIISPPPSRQVLLVYPHCYVPLEAAGGLSFKVVGAIVYGIWGLKTRDVFLFSNFGSFFICFLFWLKNGLLLPALSSLCAVYTWLLQKKPLPHRIYLLLQCPFKSDFESKCCFVNYQVDVPTGYYTIKENTGIYSFSK